MCVGGLSSNKTLMENTKAPKFKTLNKVGFFISNIHKQEKLPSQKLDPNYTGIFPRLLFLLNTPSPSCCSSGSLILQEQNLGSSVIYRKVPFH